MRFILLLVAAVLVAPESSWGGGYMVVPISRLLRVPEQYIGSRILTTGVYHPRAVLAYSVDGWLEEARARLRVIGPVFDWQPAPAQRVDMWGRLRRDRETGEPFLDFFNGRPAGDLRRVPRVTPALNPGRTVWLVGRIHQTGSVPFVRWVVVLEDRTQIDLLDFPLPGLTPTGGVLVQIYGRVESGALPPSQAAVGVLKLQEIPGPPPPPF